jgi:hypothetical protein
MRDGEIVPLTRKALNQLEQTAGGVDSPAFFLKCQLGL